MFSCFFPDVNSTLKTISDNYIDSEEDVLYQKDASFSAELEIALVPAKYSENETSKSKEYVTTQESITITTTEKRYPIPYDFFSNGFDFVHEKKQEVHVKKEVKPKPVVKAHFENNEHQSIKGTPLYTRNYIDANTLNQEHITPKGPKQNDDDNVLLAPVVLSVMEDENRINDPYSFKLYKELEGLNSLKAEGLSSKDIDMIANAELDGAANRKPNRDEELTLVTTLGPSLEQKVSFKIHNIISKKSITPKLGYSGN